MIFSIIVPIYNVEKYLRCCVDSVLAENFADYEMILVDDGSPDGCGKICDEYAGKYPHIKESDSSRKRRAVGCPQRRYPGGKRRLPDLFGQRRLLGRYQLFKKREGGGFSLIYNNLQTKRLI